MRVLIAVQSRLCSKRFPKKAFADIAGVPLIIRVAERIRKVKHPHRAVIVCPKDETKEYQDFLSKHGIDIDVFGGSENNVLERYYEAALFYGKPGIVIRVTGDNPLISVKLIDDLIDLYKGEDLSHYVGNTLGTGVEIIKFSALERSFLNACTDYQKEHVTQYIYQNPQLFDISDIKSPYEFDEFAHLSIDELSDIKNIETLLSRDSDWDISK